MKVFGVSQLVEAARPYATTVITILYEERNFLWPIRFSQPVWQLVSKGDTIIQSSISAT